MKLSNKINKTTTNLREFIIDWDNRFSFDLWWRRKYNIPFNSQRHRKMCLIDIKIERVEILLMEEYEQKMEKKRNYLEDKDIWKDSWLQSQKVDNTPLTDDEWENLDLSQLETRKENQDE